MSPGSPRRGGLEWSQVRVGVAIIVGLGILAYAIYQVGAIFNIFADRYEVYTVVPGVTGLTKGASVSLAGQRVGQVEEIDFVSVGRNRRFRLLLSLSIDKEVQHFIRTDSEARIRTQGLLGDRFVDILPGTPSAPVLQPGDTLPSVAPVDFDQLLATALATLEDAQAMTRDVRRIAQSLQRGEGTLGRLLTDPALYDRMVGATVELGTLLAEVNRADGTIGRLIRDPALYEEVRSAVARFDTVGIEVLHGEGTITQLLRSDSLYRGILGVVGRADTTVAAIGATLDSLTRANGTLKRLLADPALYDQLLKAVVDLQILINDIRAHPRRYRPDVRIDLF